MNVNKLVLALKSALILIFIFLLIVPVLSSGGQEVMVRFTPFHERTAWALGEVMMIFAAYGGFIAVFAALVDRASLVRKNRKMKRELDAVQGELQSLRQMVTQERDPE